MDGGKERGREAGRRKEEGVEDKERNKTYNCYVDRYT